MKAGSASPCSVDEFAEFLKGLTLESIDIQNCSASCRDTAYGQVERSNKQVLALAQDARLLEATEDHCVVSAFYGVRVLASEGADVQSEWMAEIDVEYRLRYSTRSLMTEGFFEQFRSLTLTLNTVPFAREWIQSTSLRMGLKPVILPLVMSNAKPPASKPEPSP